MTEPQFEYQKYLEEKKEQERLKKQQESLNNNQDDGAQNRGLFGYDKVFSIKQNLEKQHDDDLLIQEELQKRQKYRDQLRLGELIKKPKQKILYNKEYYQDQNNPNDPKYNKQYLNTFIPQKPIQNENNSNFINQGIKVHLNENNTTNTHTNNPYNAQKADVKYINIEDLKQDHIYTIKQKNKKPVKIIYQSEDYQKKQDEVDNEPDYIKKYYPQKKESSLLEELMYISQVSDKNKNKYKNGQEYQELNVGQIPNIRQIENVIKKKYQQAPNYIFTSDIHKRDNEIFQNEKVKVFDPDSKLGEGKNVGGYCRTFEQFKDRHFHDVLNEHDGLSQPQQEQMLELAYNQYKIKNQYYYQKDKDYQIRIYNQNYNQQQNNNDINVNNNSNSFNKNQLNDSVSQNSKINDSKELQYQQQQNQQNKSDYVYDYQDFFPLKNLPQPQLPQPIYLNSNNKKYKYKQIQYQPKFNMYA